MLLTEIQIDSLPKEILIELLDLLYKVEDQLNYKCKKVTKTINYLQDYVNK